jgi:hypothetical protein
MPKQASAEYEKLWQRQATSGAQTLSVRFVWVNKSMEGRLGYKKQNAAQANSVTRGHPHCRQISTNRMIGGAGGWAYSW